MHDIIIYDISDNSKVKPCYLSQITQQKYILNNKHIKLSKYKLGNNNFIIKLLFGNIAIYGYDIKGKIYVFPSFDNLIEKDILIKIK
jgi:hypothetical protein